MAIYCEFINLIIPISKINLTYEGGFNKFKEDNLNGYEIGILWHDEYLFRDGAMHSSNLDIRIKKLEKLRLIGLIEKNGENTSCDWLTYDSKTRCVNMKGKPFGEIAFRKK